MCGRGTVRVEESSVQMELIELACFLARVVFLCTCVGS